MTRHRSHSNLATAVVLLLIGTGARALAVAAGRGVTDTSSSPYVRLRSVGMDDVKWTDGFWADKFELCRRAMLPVVRQALHDPRNGAYLDNFRVAAGLKKDMHRACNWSDGDCYKWLEALAHVYAVTRNGELDRLMDQWIEIIAKAQAPDGYISTNIQIDSRKKRWQNLRHHELYNMGHLMTAACIHHRATGKDNFLKIAGKTGNYLHATFQPRPPHLARFGFNPSNIMGSVELYRATGDRKYLELARTFVNMRGSSPASPEETENRNHLGGTDCTQDRVLLRQETEAVGHCVCATYLYCGAADVYAETGEKALLDALERIWLNVTTRRMYVTGAVGSFQWGKSSRGDWVHEAFGRDYELPCRTAYNETCANIGNAMWNWRMLGLTGEAKYAEVMEVVLYNSMLSAVGTDGEGFFYCNPLKWDGRRDGLHEHHSSVRSATLSCFCCPPQVVRTIAKARGWTYCVSDRGIWVNLYAGNTLSTQFPDESDIALIQDTDYPWDGRVRITMTEVPGKEFDLMLRIPRWTEKAQLKVNGTKAPVLTKPGTYAALRRNWSVGDSVELDLNMNMRLTAAHPAVKNLHNHAAILRGPIVYCLELPENLDGGRIWRDGVFLPENPRLTPQLREDFLGGVVVLQGKALTSEGRDRFVGKIGGEEQPRAKTDWSKVLYSKLDARPLGHPENGTIDITLIPYFAWANRGPSFMEVWIPLAR